METGEALAAAIRAALSGPPGDGVIAHDGVWRDRRWLADAVDALSGMLAGADRVGLVARNRPLHVAACIANLSAGRTIAMIAPASGSNMLAETLRTLDVDAVIAGHGDWTPSALAMAEARGMIAIAADGDGPVILRSGIPRNDREGFAGPALELLSSGTTGPPKRIALPWRAVAMAVADAGRLYTGSERGARQVMVHPLGSISGLAYAVPPIVHGRPLVLLDRFSVSDWATAIRDHRPRRAAVPPAGIAMLLDAAIPPAWLASLDLVAVGGSRLDPAVQDAFETHFGVPVLTAYGATEFGGVIANWSLETYRAHGRDKRGSAGRAVPGVALRIVDPAGTVLAGGQSGLLEAQVRRIGEDWIRTTDLARIDADGFLFIEGRADGAIDRGGFKIVPDIIADMLRAHPDVADAAVVGRPDPRLGAVPVAAVEPRAGRRLLATELDAWLRDRLAPWQVPQTVLIVDALPRTATMKVALVEVAALFARN